MVIRLMPHKGMDIVNAISFVIKRPSTVFTLFFHFSERQIKPAQQCGIYCKGTLNSEAPEQIPRNY